MTAQTPATAEMKQWLRIRVRFFPSFWLQVRKKNAESRRSWLWLAGSGSTSGLKFFKIVEIKRGSTVHDAW